MSNLALADDLQSSAKTSAELTRVRLIRSPPPGGGPASPAVIANNKNVDADAQLRPGIAGSLAELGKSISNLLSVDFFVVAKNSAPVRKASWPGGADCAADALALAQRAVESGRSQVQPDKPAAGVRIIAVPLTFAGRPHGALVGRFSCITGSAADADLKALVQATAALRQQRGDAKPNPQDALDLIATALQHPELSAAATAVVNHLATLLGADRVSLGMLRGKSVRLIAVSSSAALEHATALSTAVREAMLEAIRQASTLTAPENATPATRETGAQRALLREAHCSALATVPFADGAVMTGAVTFEWAQGGPRDRTTLERCQAQLALVGPLLVNLRRADLGVLDRCRVAWAESVRNIFGPRRPVLKLVSLSAAAVLLVASLINVTHRVSGTAVLRGSVQRVVLAPVDGFIASAPARPGDLVAANAVLATLDDQALSLEVAKWQAEYNRTMNEYREAMAMLDSAKVTVLRAEVDSAAAQYELAEDNLARAEISTPIAGMVVSGDFSQSIGAPVQRGATLFELAPLDGYRVSVRVAESDVARIRAGHKGRLVLQALPGDGLDIVVERVTPVSEVVDGKNVFEVEARLLRGSPALRPGMQGVAKFEVGHARLVWLWTHDVFDWLSLKFWSLGLWS